MPKRRTKQQRIDAWLAAREASTPDGAEKSWVHAVQLAWLRHYGQKKRRR